VSILTLPMAFSLAEICAQYPTSAGAYYWCFRLATPRSRVLLSWINGWLTIVGVWTITLSVTFGTAQILVAGVQIYIEEWVPTAWQTCKIIHSWCQRISWLISCHLDLIFVGIVLISSVLGITLDDYLHLIDVCSTKSCLSLYLLKCSL